MAVLTQNILEVDVGWRRGFMLTYLTLNINRREYKSLFTASHITVSNQYISAEHFLYESPHISVKQISIWPLWAKFWWKNHAYDLFCDISSEYFTNHYGDWYRWTLLISMEFWRQYCNIQNKLNPQEKALLLKLSYPSLLLLVADGNTSQNSSHRLKVSWANLC